MSPAVIPTFTRPGPGRAERSSGSIGRCRSTSFPADRSVCADSRLRGRPGSTAPVIAAGRAATRASAASSLPRSSTTIARRGAGEGSAARTIPSSRGAGWAERRCAARGGATAAAALPARTAGASKAARGRIHRTAAPNPAAKSRSARSNRATPPRVRGPARRPGRDGEGIGRYAAAFAGAPWAISSAFFRIASSEAPESPGKRSTRAVGLSALPVSSVPEGETYSPTVR